MGLPAAQQRRYTIEEYLELERASHEKHEYIDGRIIPLGEVLSMAGGSYEHSLITANIVRELGNALKGKACRVLESNLRVRIPRTPLFAYPDVSVICGPPQFDADDKGRGTVTNCSLIVEVLSSTTEAYDRGEKFDRYRRLDSLQEYVLVSQETARVEVFLRQQGGGWLFTAFAGIDSVATLRSLALDLPLAEVYAGIEIPAR